MRIYRLTEAVDYRDEEGRQIRVGPGEISEGMARAILGAGQMRRALRLGVLVVEEGVERYPWRHRAQTLWLDAPKAVTPRRAGNIAPAQGDWIFMAAGIREGRPGAVAWAKKVGGLGGGGA